MTPEEMYANLCDLHVYTFATSEEIFPQGFCDKFDQLLGMLREIIERKKNERQING